MLALVLVVVLAPVVVDCMVVCTTTARDDMA